MTKFQCYLSLSPSLSFFSVIVSVWVTGTVGFTWPEAKSHVFPLGVGCRVDGISGVIYRASGGKKSSKRRKSCERENGEAAGHHCVVTAQSQVTETDRHGTVIAVINATVVPCSPLY